MGETRMKNGYAIMALLIGMPVWASGFGIYEQGVQGQRNVGAFTARAEDASAIFYNPGGLARLEKNEVGVSIHAEGLAKKNAPMTRAASNKPQATTEQLLLAVIRDMVL